MTKEQACKLVGFINNHYDMVSQEEYFDFCEMVFDVVITDANKGGWASGLCKEYPDLFKAV